MKSEVFRSFAIAFMRQEINLLTDPLFALLTHNYFPNTLKHTKRNDIGAEVIGRGYQSGGKELTGRDFRYDATTGCPVFFADDLIWSDSTITANGAIIYKSNGAPSRDELVAYVSFGAGDKSENGEFKLTWNKSGILLLRWGLT